jgi:hypothetical protein
MKSNWDMKRVFGDQVREEKRSISSLVEKIQSDSFG